MCQQRCTNAKYLLAISERLVAASNQSSSDLTSPRAMDQMNCCRICLHRAHTTSNCLGICNLEILVSVHSCSFTTNRANVRTIDGKDDHRWDCYDGPSSATAASAPQMKTMRSAELHRPNRFTTTCTASRAVVFVLNIRRDVQQELTMD